jgi:hypothetical protein
MAYCYAQTIHTSCPSEVVWLVVCIHQRVLHFWSGRECPLCFCVNVGMPRLGIICMQLLGYSQPFAALHANDLGPSTLDFNDYVSRQSESFETVSCVRKPHGTTASGITGLRNLSWQWIPS